MSDSDEGYQLRRVGLEATVDNIKDIFKLTNHNCRIGRHSGNDFYLDSAMLQFYISRWHAEINYDEKLGKTSYTIRDHSLNGTYVNNIRVDGDHLLEEGDVITFGHTNGKHIKPGVLAPQAPSEFQFVIEKVGSVFTPTFPPVKEVDAPLARPDMISDNSTACIDVDNDDHLSTFSPMSAADVTTGFTDRVHQSPLGDYAGLSPSNVDIPLPVSDEDVSYGQAAYQSHVPDPTCVLPRISSEDANANPGHGTNYFPHSPVSLVNALPTAYPATSVAPLQSMHCMPQRDGISSMSEAPCDIGFPPFGFRGPSPAAAAGTPSVVTQYVHPEVVGVQRDARDVTQYTHTQAVGVHRDAGDVTQYTHTQAVGVHRDADDVRAAVGQPPRNMCPDNMRTFGGVPPEGHLTPNRGVTLKDISNVRSPALLKREKSFVPITQELNQTSPIRAVNYSSSQQGTLLGNQLSAASVTSLVTSLAPSAPSTFPGPWLEHRFENSGLDLLAASATELSQNETDDDETDDAGEEVTWTTATVSQKAKATKGRKRAKGSAGTRKRQSSTGSNSQLYHSDDDKCDAYDCRSPSGNKVSWVQCDDCDKWYHTSCAGCNYSVVRQTNAEFHCGCT